MGIRIIKQGLLDTVQDHGRYGHQHWGINPGGAMDAVAMRVANMLAGNEWNEPVIEMHFPAAELLFEEPALVAVAGADFNAAFNGMACDTNKLLLVRKNDRLHFTAHRKGSRAYLSVKGGIVADEWLNSCSTHLKVQAGGFAGRALHKNDTIRYKYAFKQAEKYTAQPAWRADVQHLYNGRAIRFIPGAEYHLLDEASKEYLHNEPFLLGRKSDRMGYRLEGVSLGYSNHQQIISTAVTRGTIQLLPDGQLMVLMADHQTTGGYPRIGHVIGADISSLSQTVPGSEIRFSKTDLATAEKLFIRQQTDLRLLQNACTLRLTDWLQQ
ncbi:5-oxoprolinase subunit C family protein [Sediminibacterium soli]|uniref:5-oxoprolinase subunit C family protein n=1 Tax=Sediminibacterium soli TaxID=2698829 RepID=UPI00137A0FE6|nr:biotin-dependent carboxyltransferase family protein [Sediminibacterium soli]NCI45089.1 biotin-dependent carboxyltransferase family protein [Sediminibacterium soli]